MPDDALPLLSGAKAQPAKAGRWRPSVTFALAFSTCGLILLSMAVVVNGCVMALRASAVRSAYA